MTEPVSIRRVKVLESRLHHKSWAWAEENRSLIDSCWQESLAEKPKMFNGRVLLMGDYAELEDRIEASYFETDFADFLAWLKLGRPDKTVGNGFSSAALQSSDGAYICGVMGEHTANAGRVYFPGGTPDLSDIRDNGTVDLLGSVLRELEEETGLRPSEVTIADHWITARWWPYVSFMRVMQLAEDAVSAVERLNANLATQKEPEFSGFRIVRGLEDIDSERMPEFVQAFFRQEWREKQ